MNEKVIRVFISSTFKDLREERETIKQGIIEEMNPTFSSSGIFLYPVDLRSGARPNPPKEECLEEVAKSHVVVGLIAFRYGSIDEQTGKSISELEYDKACECNIDALMYIKDPDSEVKTYHFDTKPDLIQKREAFQRKVEKNRKREKFKTREDLWKSVHRDLSRLVLEKFLPTSKAVGQVVETRPTPQAKEEPTGGVSEEEVSGAGKEIKDLLKSISANVSDLKKIDGQKRRRLYLLATSMFYHTELSGVLGTHEIQLLYRDRKNVLPLGREITFLAKSIFADQYSVKAGWFWILKVGSEGVHEYLRWLCMNEGDEDIRVGFLDLIKNFWSRTTETIVCENARSKSKKICLVALSTLEELGSENCLNVLDDVENHEDPEVVKAARKAKFAVLAHNNPLKAASLFGKFEGPEAVTLESKMTSALQRVKVADLRKLRNQENEKIKKLATIELARRGKLDDEELIKLTKSKDAEMRYEAYTKLIDKGRKFDLKKVCDDWESIRATTLLTALVGRRDLRDEIIVRILKTYSLSEVQKSIDWVSPNGKLAYLVWGMRSGRLIMGTVRKDLENKFYRLKQTYLATLKELRLKCEKVNDKVTLMKVQGLVDGLDKYEDFMASEFAESALKILMEHAERKDIRFAKEFINSDKYNVKRVAAELFIKLSGKEELSGLVDIALNETGEIKAEAARKVLLIDEKELALDKFLKSNDATLVKLCLKKKLEEKQLLENAKIERLLRHEKHEIREMIVAYLMEGFERKRKKLERVLEEYLENGKYYYNVVCWLDRILYAPRTFKIMFRKELVRKLN